LLAALRHFVAPSVKQSRTLHTLTTGAKTGVHFRVPATTLSSSSLAKRSLACSWDGFAENNAQSVDFDFRKGPPIRVMAEAQNSDVLEVMAHRRPANC
jgi:hypothetical protein